MPQVYFFKLLKVIVFQIKIIDGSGKSKNLRFELSPSIRVLPIYMFMLSQPTHRVLVFDNSYSL